MILDGARVDRVLRPGAVDELAEMLSSEAGPVAPVGGGGALSFGNPLGHVDWILDTRGLSRIVEYVPADLTVHVEAGLRLGALQAVLAEQNQMLPLDPWNGADATVGGVVAANAQGPLRTMGSARDWIIGMQVVHADGARSRTGGRVVKNVSGYDLAKLYTGALGSLAVITEVSFKLRARFDRTASARFEAEGVQEAFQAAREIARGPFDPIALVVAGPPPAVCVRFGEHRSAVAWQMERLPGGPWDRREPSDEDAMWTAVHEFYAGMPAPVVRVAAPSSVLASLVERFRPSAWLAHASVGVLLMSVDEAQVAAVRAEHPAILERASLETRRRVPTFGLGRIEHQLMRDLKARFDPDGRLNPGRHVDGEAAA